MLLPSWARGLSLSVKLPLLVGLAVLSIVVIALTPSWLRMRDLIRRGQSETSRALVQAWAGSGGEGGPRPGAFGDAVVRVLTPTGLAEAAAEEPGLAGLARRLGGSPEVGASAMVERWDGLARVSRYGQVREGASGGVEVVVLERRSENAGALLAVSSMYVLAAGLVVLGVALWAFYLIASRLVLRPLRTLRLWADAVRDGNLDERSEVTTGDEFQQLAETCNLMLDGLQSQQRRLRAINASMDVKLNELAEANDALDRAARLKGEFIANMSHELRTPLNAIIGFGELLLDFARTEAKAYEGTGRAPEVLERRRRYLDHIVRAARGLLQLIEGMLELARIEAGKTELRTERVDLVELSRGLVAMLQPQAASEGVAVSLDVRGEVPSVETDARKVQQILLNLLSNAIKFTAAAPAEGEAPRVDVRVEGLSGGAGGGAVRVSVIDNGPGVPPEHQQRIFQKFEQIESGVTRAVGGAGLGLAISRELAAALQGEIQLVSETGRGSMFSLILPLRLDGQTASEFLVESRFRGLLSRS